MRWRDSSSVTVCRANNLVHQLTNYANIHKFRQKRSNPLCTPLTLRNQNKWHSKNNIKKRKREWGWSFSITKHILNQQTPQAVDLVTARFSTNTQLWAVSLISMNNECEEKNKTKHPTSPCTDLCTLLFCSLANLTAATLPEPGTCWIGADQQQSPVIVTVIISMFKEMVEKKRE